MPSANFPTQQAYTDALRERYERRKAHSAEQLAAREARRKEFGPDPSTLTPERAQEIEAEFRAKRKARADAAHRARDEQDMKDYLKLQAQLAPLELERLRKQREENAAEQAARIARHIARHKHALKREAALIQRLREQRS